jgi:hypothetical protein
MMRAAERRGTMPSISFSEDNTSGAFATDLADAEPGRIVSFR